MKLDNKGFLLYEALISLLVLCSFITFYTSVIQITKKQQYYNNIKFEAFMAFRESIYNKEQNGYYLKYKEKDYYSQQNGKEYCIIYEQYKEQEKICD